MDKHGKINVTKKSGKEKFKSLDKEICLRDFWSWAFSDLVSNASRGVLAEFIVASALDITSGIRDEWDDKDLVVEVDGIEITIEVKSSAYIQSWEQEDFYKIDFDIKKRKCDVYVFCALAEKDREKIDPPLDVAKWKFYVMSTRMLDERVPGQKKIRLSVMPKKLKPDLIESKYKDLKNSVEKAGRNSTTYRLAKCKYD